MDKRIVKLEYKEYKNFFNLEECNELINNFKENVPHHEAFRDTIVLRLEKVAPRLERIPWLVQGSPAPLKLERIPLKLIRTLQKDFNITLNYSQIVHWPNGSFMKRHCDSVPGNNFTSLCYLNDNFKGGRTLFQHKNSNPKMGKVLVFNGEKIEHGVEKVIGDRFTYISWWKKNNE